MIDEEIESIEESSFSIVKFGENDYKAVTSLHSMNTVIANYKKKIFGTFREIPISIQHNKKLFTKNLFKNDYFEFKVSDNYFKSRLSFLQKLNSSEKLELLLDTEYQLHIMPSIDICLMDLPEDLIKKINANEIYPLIPGEIQNSEVYPHYLIGYHETNNCYEKTNEDYMYSNIPDDFLIIMKLYK